MDIEKPEQIAPSGAGESGGDAGEFQSLPRRQLVLTMAAVMLAMFVSSLDQTVVSTAMPRVIAELGGFAHYAWVTTAYMVSSTAVLPIVGKLSDIYGRKWIYVVGIIIFLIGSLLSGFSQSMNQLIFFRALQGIGGGIMMASAIIVVGDLFPPAERGKYAGFMMSVMGLSSIIGPTIGGFLTDNWSWRWVFFVNIPFGILAVVFFVLYFPKIRPAAVKQKFDYFGVTTMLLAVVPLLLGISWGGSEYPWGSAQVIGTLTFSAVMAGLFILAESRAADPFIPLGIFKNRIVGVSMIPVFLTGVAMFGSIIFIPLFFQGVMGASASKSGNFLIPMMLGLLVGSILSGQALSRMGGHYRTQGLVGVAIMALGTALLARMGVNTSYGQMVFNTVMVGFGLGITMPVLTIAVQNAVPYRLMGVATSSTQFVRSIGGTIGMAIFGSVMTARFTSELTSTVSPGVKEALQPGQLSALTDNPQALVSPEAQEQLRTQLDSHGPELFPQLMDALRHALSSAIAEIFLIALVLTLIALVATIFLKEIPLQGRKAAVKESAPPQNGGK